jgi:hypothetical protein
LALWWANAISKSVSIWSTAWIISVEMAWDIVAVWMVPDGIKSFVYNYDYNLWESFKQNLMFAPLVLLWGWGKSIIKHLERAQLKHAIWDSSWAIKDIKLFNKNISELKSNLVKKEFNIDIEWKAYNIQIQADWKIIKKENWTDIILDWTKEEDAKIIKKLAIEIQEQWLGWKIKPEIKYKYTDEKWVEKIYTKKPDWHFYDENWNWVINLDSSKLEKIEKYKNISFIIKDKSIEWIKKIWDKLTWKTKEGFDSVLWKITNWTVITKDFFLDLSYRWFKWKPLFTEGKTWLAVSGVWIIFLDTEEIWEILNNDNLSAPDRWKKTAALIIELLWFKHIWIVRWVVYHNIIEKIYDAI